MALCAWEGLMATYYVNPGDSVNSIFSANDLGGGDVVELRATTPGGSTTFTEDVVVGSNDSGWEAGALVTLQGRAGDLVAISAASGSYALSIPLINYFKTENITAIGGTVSAIRATGTGQRFNNVTAYSQVSSASGLYVSAPLTGFFADGLRCNGSSGKGAFVNAVSTGTITNSSFSGNGNHGCQGNLGGLVFSDCEFSNNGGHGHWASGSTVVAHSLTRCIAEDNVATDLTYRHGFCFAPSSGTLSNFTVDSCLSKNVDIALDIQATSGNNSNGLITKNILIGKGAGQTERGTGLFLGSTNASFSNSLIDVYKNIIATEDALGQAIFVDLYNNANIKLRYNILVNFSGGNVYSCTAGAPFLDSDYNLFWSTKDKPFNIGGVDYTFAEYQALSGKDAHSIFADPKFVDALNGDYHLQPTSPCLNAGTTIAGITTDLDGNQYPSPNGASIGPYEDYPLPVDGMGPWRHFNGSTDQLALSDTSPANLLEVKVEINS